jgi:hypothetical protein
MSLALFVILAGMALGAEMPPLLSQTPAPAVIPGGGGSGDGYCPPPPPVAEAYCPPPEEPYCPPPPPITARAEEICPPPPALAPAPVVEMRAVPVRRKVVEEECYVVNEKRSLTVDELRTRPAQRKVPVVKTRLVSEAKIYKVASPSGRATRLARGVTRKVTPYQSYDVENFMETYTAQVRQEYTEPVLKTRKVTRYVDEVEYVARRVGPEACDD